MTPILQILAPRGGLPLRRPSAWDCCLARASVSISNLVLLCLAFSDLAFPHSPSVPQIVRALTASLRPYGYSHHWGSTYKTRSTLLGAQEAQTSQLSGFLLGWRWGTHIVRLHLTLFTVACSSTHSLAGPGTLGGPATFSITI